jgi:hypothetical protein
MANIVSLLTFAACWFGAGSIWMAQHNWILFRQVGPGEFGSFHTAWLRGLFWAGLPMSFLALAGNIAELWWHASRVPVALVAAALVLQLAVLVATAVWWGPAQQRMTYARTPGGTLDPLYLRLCNANWTRVAVVSAVGILQTAMFAEVVR